MLELTKEPFFGFSLCMFSYIIGIKINQKTKSALANPMIIAAIIIIAVLAVFKIPLENFMIGADFVAMFLAPATAALAVSMYRQFDVIKKNWLPIVVGCVVGAVSAVVSIVVLCKFLNMPQDITASLVPKSITTAIASKLSEQLGGIVPITLAAVLVTGIFGAISSPYLIKLFKIDNPIASGLAIGASCHALGTSKAIEIGEIEGTLSGIAVGLCGLVTVFIAIFL
ncbi:MAG: LrgB family protein [Clostridia bacterium]|nr:LrgB family protein [Clostridia bacterium]